MKFQWPFHTFQKPVSAVPNGTAKPAGKKAPQSAIANMFAKADQKKTKPEQKTEDKDKKEVKEEKKVEKKVGEYIESGLVIKIRPRWLGPMQVRLLIRRLRV